MATRKVLTHQAMQQPGWEAAMTLPPAPNEQLLTEAIGQVFWYLDWVVEDGDVQLRSRTS